MSRTDDLTRIREALLAAAEAVRPFTGGDVAVESKGERGDPLTEADLAANRVLRAMLPRDGEGWLSEESLDDAARLACEQVWVVDPIDGTREFVAGIPEWCISVALVQRGVPVAGGILNPMSGELILGSMETGVTCNGQAARVRSAPEAGARGSRPHPSARVVLVSRTEASRGEWDHFRPESVLVRPCGSVAYKMALVAAGRADATWTRVPKSEWDVAAGAALVRAAGGRATLLDGSEPLFNRESPRVPNFIAAEPGLWRSVVEGGMGGDE